MTCALDTNTIIDYLNGDTSVMEHFLSTAKSNTPMLIPSTVDYEISRGFYHTPNPRKEAVYNNMRLNCPVIEVNAEIWDCAAKVWAKLRKNGFTVGDADILIASVCLANEYTLVTHNTKDFVNIDGLQLVDWAE